MSNPNNCATCKYKELLGPDNEGAGLHCYMFKDAPTEQCMQHTGHEETLLMASFAIRTALAKGGLNAQMRKVVDSLITVHKP